jgi:hypothetical protein
MIKFQHIESSDKQFFVVAVIAPIVAWWFFIGRKKYSVKGMK